MKTIRHTTAVAAIAVAQALAPGSAGARTTSGNAPGAPNVSADAIVSYKAELIAKAKNDQASFEAETAACNTANPNSGKTVISGGGGQKATLPVQAPKSAANAAVNNDAASQEMFALLQEYNKTKNPEILKKIQEISGMDGRTEANAAMQRGRAQILNAPPIKPTPITSGDFATALAAQGGVANKQMAAVMGRSLDTNPTVQACLDTVEKKHAPAEDPLRVFQDLQFTEAANTIKKGQAESVIVELSSGQVFNVVSAKHKSLPLDEALKASNQFGGGINTPANTTTNAPAAVPNPKKSFQDLIKMLPDPKAANGR